MMLLTRYYLDFSLLLLALCLLSPPVAARQKSSPIYIVSDVLKINDKKGTSSFKGRVKFRQGDLVIRADSIDTRSKNGSIYRVLVKGKPIKMDQKTTGKPVISARANKIEYFADSEMVHLYGDALLQQGQQTFRGEHIQYNSRTQQVIANGTQQTTKAGGQGRVKAVIMPKTKTDPDK